MSDIPLGADLPLGSWECEYCGSKNSDLDSDCQFCDGADIQPENDPAWQSEAHLRNMEGYGDYEGPVTWP